MIVSIILVSLTVATHPHEPDIVEQQVNLCKRLDILTQRLALPAKTKTLNSHPFVDYKDYNVYFSKNMFYDKSSIKYDIRKYIRTENTSTYSFELRHAGGKLYAKWWEQRGDEFRDGGYIAWQKDKFKEVCVF